MKLRTIYTFSFLIFISIVFLSNSTGRAISANEGNTGAPDDNNNNNRTCQTCHNNGSFSVTPAIEIKDAGGDVVSTNLNGGETYNVKITVNSSGTPGGYGFQVVALNAATGVAGDPVNTWSIPSGSDNVQVATISNGRQYAEHKGISNGNEFNLEFTAPASGDVTFYFGGNAVNDNGNTNGDNAIMTSAEFATSPSAVNELEQKVALTIFPNPVAEVMSLRSNSESSDIYDLFLYDQNGRLISLQKLNIPSGENISPIEVAQLSTGTYYLILSDGKNQIAKKFVKK